MGPDLTFDTGALIAWQNRQQSVARIVLASIELKKRIYVPQVVIAEWWRSGSPRCEEIMRAIQLDPLSVRQAKAAGEVLGRLGGGGAALTIDALVMASAAERGDIVYTSDPGDLLRLKDHFPAVRQVVRV